jgi:flagellar hook-basal body complex protein FliE
MTINNVTGVRTDISEMLSKIREISNNSKVFSELNSIKPANANTPPTHFDSVLNVAKNAVSHVNKLDMQDNNIRDAYVSGDKNVSMSQVLIASQKSKLAFEGLVTVRNKLLEAYKEIMNMPV